MTFMIASYNVLATAYIKSAWYPTTPVEVLRPAYHRAAIADRLAHRTADVYCLQEVEPEMFAACDRRLRPMGYVGELAMKEGRKPDGCAVFVRRSRLDLVRAVRLVYEDAGEGTTASGHVAQLVVVRAGGHLLGVANTHLKWDPPGTPREAQLGYRQVRLLLEARAGTCPECEGWVLCGDLNATPDSDVVAAIRAAGFEHAHAGVPGAATCNANRNARQLDYVFHDAALTASPVPLPEVRDDTTLPSPAEPSDHVVVAALCEWR